MAPEKGILVTCEPARKKDYSAAFHWKLVLNWNWTPELDYSIKDAGFEILIEVGVKELDDIYTLNQRLLGASSWMNWISVEKTVQ